jgi:prepilin-type N-terminal cleavage/methylation domain-containing protein
MRKRETTSNGRGGLTLVELLVVIVILSLVTAATIPLMQPATAERRLREASRMVASVLANAQARAVSTGRPVGVMFQRLSNQPATPTFKAPHHSMEMVLCEVPPPYTGETSQATALIGQSTPPPPNERLVAIREGPMNQPPVVPPRTIRNGDRIRFNYRGHYYPIEGNTTLDNEGYLTGDTFKITKQQNQQWPQLATPVPFQIYRQPQKTADAPAQMPVGSVVDLEYSGYASGWLGALATPPSGAPKLSFHQPLVVMFGPAGNLESVYWGTKPANSSDSERGSLERRPPVSSPWFLLIGQPAGDDAVTQGKQNHLNYDHVWIAINPQSGLVTTSEVGSDFDEPDTNNNNGDISIELDASRALAKSAQNMGGR